MPSYTCDMGAAAVAGALREPSPRGRRAIRFEMPSGACFVGAFAIGSRPA